MEGAIPRDSSVREHIDSCLGCRACETACPSGVEYGQILESFRADIETDNDRPFVQRMARKQLLDMITNPSRFRLALKAGGLMERVAGKRESMPSLVGQALTGQSNVKVALPATPEKLTSTPLPEVSPAYGERTYRVALLAGCAMRLMFDEVHQATIEVLRQNGCEVIVPPAMGCCGALHLHSGYQAEAISRAKALVASLDPGSVDAIIVNSAGCGSTMKEYGHLLGTDGVVGDRAKAFAAKTKDVSEWLVECGIRQPNAQVDETVAYHDACHLAHAQKITSAPRQLLRAVPGLKIVDLPESDTCCGSAGVYNMTQPALAGRLLENKVNFILKTGATVLASGNPGCTAWIQKGLRDKGSTIQVKHPVELLAKAYRS
jgi:glycolate oxidase iron-sulfur subunit